MDLVIRLGVENFPISSNENECTFSKISPLKDFDIDAAILAVKNPAITAIKKLPKAQANIISPACHISFISVFGVCKSVVISFIYSGNLKSSHT